MTRSAVVRRPTTRLLVVVAFALSSLLVPGLGQSAPAEARTGPCGGRLVGHYPVKARVDGQRKKIAELAVFWNQAAGRNCARMNHAGPTWGKRLRTRVFLAPCLERKPNRTCTYHGSKARRDIGQFKEYAGPVSVKARNRCIHAAGTITFRGKRHSVVAHPKGKPLYAYHCG